jgi:hypothetical protein
MPAKGRVALKRRDSHVLELVVSPPAEGIRRLNGVPAMAATFGPVTHGPVTPGPVKSATSGPFEIEFAAGVRMQITDAATLKAALAEGRP